MLKTTVLEVPPEEVKNRKIFAQEKSIFKNFLD
jgi:hypothetical protein